MGYCSCGGRPADHGVGERLDLVNDESGAEDPVVEQSVLKPNNHYYYGGGISFQYGNVSEFQFNYVGDGKDYRGKFTKGYKSEEFVEKKTGKLGLMAILEG
ncbi:OLC1v1005719C1 [Oldenlandia corymbosa var. corymbosa]|uniref:OLC1v1005719C1 n=1 Tax=Oldenlandia corymbosa var. corymbosa TaxID=529605 RepID=A0AAV1DF73_OLDCO|nr:OLC1v1005719C1 [Oldenlandia corymbosa var. corymbosa]